jgi:hypothetical protein
MEFNSQKVVQTKEEVEQEEEIPEDIDIQEDEFQRILIGGADSSDRYNSKGDYQKNKKQNRTKSKAKKQNKMPFKITVIEDTSYKKIKIVFYASTFIDESIMPIWCPKDSFIKFKVKGKWRIDKLYPYTDSKGLPSNNKGGFGYGALIGRIGKGEKFVVSDDKAVIVKEEGPLFMKQLLPKNMKIEPEGSIEVCVYDGEYMNIDEINEKIGWIENNIENKDINNKNEIFDDNTVNKKEDNMKKEFENKIRNEINNLRMNPLIYYELNLYLFLILILVVILMFGYLILLNLKNYI